MSRIKENKTSDLSFEALTTIYFILISDNSQPQPLNYNPRTYFVFIL